MASSKLNFFFYSLGIAISGILSFLFIPVVVQKCGKEVYATYTMIFSTLSIVCMFCYSWIGQSFVRFYSQNSVQLYDISIKLLKKSLSIGVIIFIPLCYLFASQDIYDVLLFIPTFYLFGFYCFYLWVFQVKQKALLLMICEVLRTTISIISTIFLLSFFGKQNAVELLAISLFLSYLFPFLILHFQEKKIKVIYKNEDSNEIKKQIIKFGIPMAIFSSCSLALSVNDRFFISHLIDKNAAGTYSAIYDVINKGVVAAFSPILMTYYPVVFKLYNENNEQKALSKIRKLVWLEIFLMIVGFLILLQISPYLLKIIFKKDVDDSLIWVINWIYLGVCLWQIAMLIHKPLELKQQTTFMALAIFSALVLNTLINYFVIKMYPNLLTPALTTVFGSVVYIILILYYRLKKSVHSIKI